MKRSDLLLLIFLAAASPTQAGIITQWNFNSNPADGSTSTGTLTPSTGVGTATVLGTAAINNYYSGNNSTDPAPPADNSALGMAPFPAQGQGNKTTGAQFSVSTSGYTGITVKWDQQESNTGSKYARFQYTTDGSLWVDYLLFTASGPGVFNNWSADLSGVAVVENNPSFGFRVVSEFAPGTSTYAPANNGSTYGTSGTWRFDMVTIEGTAVPEPGVLLTSGLVLAGGVGMWAYRRQQAK